MSQYRQHLKRTVWHVHTLVSWHLTAVILAALVTSVGQTWWPLAESVSSALPPVVMTGRHPPRHNKNIQTINHTASHTVEVLGPLLYLLYTAELALNLHQYADDTQDYVSTSARKAETAIAGLTACLVDIKTWLNASRPWLNPTKTQIMWLGSPQQLAKVKVLEVPVVLTRINVWETARDLGVVIDSQLWLSAQVAAVATTSYGSSDRSSDLCQPRL